MVVIYFLFTRGDPCLYSYLFSLLQVCAQFSYLILLLFMMTKPTLWVEQYFHHMALKLVRII